METDEDLDTHICLACQLPILGLDNYIYHKKHDCPARKQKQTGHASLSSLSEGFMRGNATVSGPKDDSTVQSSVNDSLVTMQLPSQQLSPAVCHAMSLLAKSPPISTSAGQGRYNTVNPNMVLETMSGTATSEANLSTPASDTLPVTTLSSNLTTSTPSIMDFLSTLELQCRPHTSPEKLGSGTADTLEDHNVRVPDGLKLANLLNDLNFDSDSEGFDMPSDAEDLLNFTEDDYRELGGAYIPQGGKGKGHSEGKGHMKGKCKGKGDKGDYQHPGKNKKDRFSGKWKPGERNGGKMVRWSSIGKRHYEEMSSDGEDSELAADVCNMGVTGNQATLDAIEDAVNKNDSYEQDCENKKEYDQIDKMEATAPNMLLQVKSEIRETPMDHTYDGAAQDGEDHTYDSNKGALTLLKCEPCDRLFRNSLALHSHMRSAQHKASADGLPIVSPTMKSEGPFHVECCGCQRSFNNKYNYARHLVSSLHLKRSKSTLLNLDPAFQRMLLPLKLFQCGICQFYCNSHDDLLEHMSSDIHSDNMDKLIGPMTCKRCRFVTHSPREMYEHFKSQEHSKTICESDRPCVLREIRHDLPCVHCEKIFHSAVKLQQHLSSQHSLKKKKCKGMPHSTHCDICDKTFSSYHNLAQHTRRKHQKNPQEYKCDICNSKNFADQSYLDHHYKSQRHIQNVINAASTTDKNVALKDFSPVTEQLKAEGSRGTQKMTDLPPNKLLKCKECDFYTSVYSELRPHYIDVHGKNVVCDFMCDLCGVGFHNQVKLDIHLASQRHTKVAQEAKTFGHQALVCSICAHKFYSQDRFSLHVLQHRSSEPTPVGREKKKEFYLRGVPQKFHNFVKKLPVGKKKNSKDVQCPECKEWCKAVNIVSHILGQHSDPKELPFKCNFCPKTFPSNGTLYRHHKAHLNIKNFACDLCGKTYRNGSELSTHRLNAHSDLDVVAKFQCNICGDRFMQKTKLNIHMKKKHQEKKDFPCTWPGCHREFIYQSEFSIHFRTHTGERPYLCDYCGFSTKTKIQLRRHERSHTGESNYKCKYCTYSASHSWGLRRHMRIHSGVKPYKCPHCDYRCNCHTNLRHHIVTSKRHPGMCLYLCKVCGFSSNKGNEFQQHCILMHSIAAAKVENVAEYCGVYIPEDDSRDVQEGSQVFPAPERKPRTKKAKKLCRLRHAGSNESMKNLLDVKTECEAPDKKIMKFETLEFTGNHPTIKDHNCTTELQLTESDKAVMDMMAGSQTQHVVCNREEIVVKQDSEEAFIPNYVANHGTFQGTIQDDTAVLHVTHHDTNQDLTQISLPSELSNLISPHVEGVEQTGAVVELHMEEEYLPTSRHGQTLQLIGQDNKPIHFYYL